MTAEQTGDDRTTPADGADPVPDEMNALAAAADAGWASGAERSAPDDRPAAARDVAAIEADTVGDDESQVAAAARDAGAPPPPDEHDLSSRIESLLFVSDGPVDEGVLARALGLTRRRLDRGLQALAEQLREAARGVRVQRGPEGAQLVTAPESAAHVEYFLGLEAARRLSTAALETLAIVAYRQPVTRGRIEAIRGVSSDAAVATLRARGLIAEGGRAEGPGRPVLWVTTQRFLQHFGLERPADLPPLPADVELPEEEVGLQLGLSPDAAVAADADGDAPAGVPSSGKPAGEGPAGGDSEQVGDDDARAGRAEDGAARPPGP